MLWKGQKTQGMHPSSLGGGGGLKTSEKSLLGGQKFLFWCAGWGGGVQKFLFGVGGGGVILLRGEGIILLAGSHNFEVKIKTA